VDKHSGSEDCKNSESNHCLQQQENVQENDSMDESKDNDTLGESCDSSPRIYRGLDVANRYKESKFGILENRLKSVLERQKTLPMKTVKPLKSIRYFIFLADQKYVFRRCSREDKESAGKINSTKFTFPVRKMDSV
jgi:hypothetical protein